MGWPPLSRPASPRLQVLVNAGGAVQVTIERTAAKWIVELAELTGIGRRDVETIKAFITRQTDEAREAFARKVTRAPRQFVLLGTTNDDRYLIDGTGNRRFLPIRVLGGAGSINLNGIREVRDQLWAEAAVREAEKEPIELPREMWALANAEQEQRRLIHPIETRLVELLDGVEVGFVPNKEIRRALHFKVDRTETRQQKLADEAMQRLGWRRLKKAVKVGPSFRERGWAKGDSYRDCILSFQGDPSDPESGKFVGRRQTMSDAGRNTLMSQVKHSARALSTPDLASGGSCSTGSCSGGGEARRRR